jgi:diguanylate cyclase (GGDEF)-like protein
MFLLPRRIRLSNAALNMLGGALLALATGVILATVLGLRSDALTEARQNASNFATALAEQTTRTVQSVDLIVRDLQERIANMGVDQPLAKRLGGLDTYELLRDRLARLPQAEALTVVGADGDLISSTRSWPPPAVNVRDRGYFRHFAASNDNNLLITAPLANRVTGDRTIYIIRRISGPNGEFLGLMQAAVRLSYFQDIYAPIAKSNYVGLTRPDGTLLVEMASGTDAGVRQALFGPTWRDIVASGGGSYREADHGARTVAVHPLREYDLVMNVGVNEDELLRRWRRQAAGVIIGTIIVLFCAMTMLRAFRAKSRELEITLNNMAQGIMMVDAKRHVPVLNRQAVHLLGLPDEFLTKPVTFDEVLAFQRASSEFGKDGAAVEPKIWNAIQNGGMAYDNPIYERVRPNGTALEIRTVPVPGGGLVRTYSDVTARRRAEEEVRRMAFRDVLTGLANRALLHERLTECFQRQSRDNECFAVICLDLDRFKTINDTLGHASGDALLKQVASRLLDCVRGTDLVARVGGDEFVIVYTGIDEPLSVIPLVHRLLGTISAPCEVNGQHLVAGTSIGIAIAPNDGTTPDEILRHADLALYRAKSDGRGAYRFFEPEMQAAADAKARLEAEMRTALEKEEFEVHYLPWIDCATDRIGGCEALVRWQHPTRGLLPPSEFVPLAEECGLIGPLGEWVLRRATMEARTWPAGTRLAVNVSAAQFLGNDLTNSVTTALARSGFPAHQLELEVTESLLLFKHGEQRAILQQLRRLGAHIVLDDFGTGYSSFSYLDMFPFSRLKIDRSFVSRMLTRPHCAAIVAAAIGLGRSLDMLTTAEGVETAEQYAALKASGCNDAQGFLFGMPRPGQEIAQLLSDPVSLYTAA